MTTSVAWGRVAPLTERGLWAAAQRGDQAAREELVRRYEPLVQATLRRMHLPRRVESPSGVGTTVVATLPISRGSAN